jgi:hypothetical protein
MSGEFTTREFRDELDTCPQLGRGHRMLNIGFQGKILAWRKGLTKRRHLRHSIRPKVTVVSACPAPGDEVPALEIVNQTYRFDDAAVRCTQTGCLIREMQDLATGERMLQKVEIRLNRCIDLRCKSHSHFCARTSRAGEDTRDTELYERLLGLKEPWKEGGKDGC